MWIPAAKCYATVRLCNASMRMHAFMHQVEQQKATYVTARLCKRVNACTHAFVDQQHMTIIIAMTCKQKTAARRENDFEEHLK